MSFLAPLFLLGTLVIGAPVVFHLIRRTTRERKPFSSLMFLEPSPPRLTRRSRLEHLLLLLLRCAAICLLAIAFARPFLKRALPPESPSTARRILVLLDSSASMRRADLWSQAENQAEAILRQTTPADQAAVFTFDRELTPVVGFDSWNSTAPGARVAAALAKLKTISPSWSDTHLGTALIQAAEILADPGGKQVPETSELIVVSDLQEGSHLQPVQGYEWPHGVQVRLNVVQARHRGNASIQLLPGAEASSAKGEEKVRVLVSNSADSGREEYRVGWADAAGSGFMDQPMSVYVPVGQSRVAALPLPTKGADRIRLEGDENDFDNTVFFVPPQPDRLKVLYLGLDTPGNSGQPLYFLKRAFQETRSRIVEVVPHRPDSPLVEAELKEPTLIVVADPLPEGLTTAIHTRAAAGATVLFLVRTEAAATSLAGLLQVDNLAAHEANLSNYALLGGIDFGNPIFAPFADPRFSDFSKIHFWKYRKLDVGPVPGGEVLARFDSGDPALFQAPVGKGKVVVLTSGWEPEQSQLALSTKFVPLLYSILDQAGRPAPPAPQFQVGQTIPLASLGIETGVPLVIREPDGSEVKVGPNETNFARALVPGVYTALSASPKRFAVNLNPTESLTMPLSVDQLEQLSVPLASLPARSEKPAGARARLAGAELEARQRLWRWALILTAAVLIGETWLGGWTARRASMVTN